MQMESAETSSRPRAAAAELFELAKPGIVGLTLVAALTGIYFGNHEIMPHWDLIFWTFFTLGLATAGSCMLNNCYDSDIDKLMRRTRLRALAMGLISRRSVLILGLLLVIPSLVLMAWTVNALAALVTYAAVTGDLGAPAWILFAIMVVWQQPHALSLAMKYREDYAKAKVPVIPVACGIQATKVRIVIYALALVPVALLPYFYGMSGIYYLGVSGLLSAIFLFMAVRFLHSNRDCDMRVFAYSIIYLILLFGMMVADSI